MLPSKLVCVVIQFILHIEFLFFMQVGMSEMLNLTEKEKTDVVVDCML
jgi:hypothetical protein